MQEAPPAPAPAPPEVVMDPERAAVLRQQLTSAVMVVLDKVLLDVARAPSTGSMSERMLLATLRPTLPKLRAVLLSKLSEADPVGLELVMGAFATAIESTLYWAPGEPLPRRRFDWTEDGSLVLVPIDAPEQLADG